MNNLFLESIPILGTAERTVLSEREIKLRKLAEVTGWHMGGLVRHAKGHQICFWRGGVAFIKEHRVARKKVARWVMRELRRDLRGTK